MIHICDDFLTDPYTVRNHALKQKFITEEPFNYPGVRSSNIPSEIKDYISSYVRKFSYSLIYPGTFLTRSCLLSLS